MKANQLREKYFAFFEKKGHRRVPAALLVPENDPTTLFVSSGMQPMMPYLLGEKHPLGSRIVNSQPCIRTQDIKEVGDGRHTTFFEMLGNWSLGDYFKKEQLAWFFEFLTGEIGLDPARLYVTVFAGNDQVQKDQEAIEIWQELFKTKKAPREGKEGFDPEVKVYLYGSKKNWWSRSGAPDQMPTGEPGGPDSEMFFDFGADLGIHERSIFAQNECHLNCDCGRFLEIGNSVFMEYQKNQSGGFDKLPARNIDFGGGFERILASSWDQPDIFRTELFYPIIGAIQKATGVGYRQNPVFMQVIADHLKAAVFLVDQGVEPSNKQQGYVLRRLLRRAVVKMQQLKKEKISETDFEPLCEAVLRIYQGIYFDDIAKRKKKIAPVISQEVDRFNQNLIRGLRIVAETVPEEINGQFAFKLFSTYGFPFEVTRELALVKGIDLAREAFEKEFKGHQAKSRTAARGMFKGGLADSSERIVKLHTATHLLHQALRKVLGNHVRQVGSNITAERLRFDFTHPEKLTPKQVKEIQDIVNQTIDRGLEVKKEIMSLAEAEKCGALAFFKERYAREVTVYSIGGFSREVCAGPHVQNTRKVGHVEITKEESVGTGRRRLYMILKELPNGS
ncbi:MAG: alanine--tRNA ligase [Candidatus Pacebacteria bacterium]|nr:alanine--tRNA ligase [Candidatus Paceibacterota bacterium]